MKTEIYPGSNPVARSGRLTLPAATLIATLFAGNLFGAPTVQTLGGGASTGHSGYQDGETLYALFNTPKGLALDSSGDLFIADYGNNAVREVVGIDGAGNGTTETWDKSPNINAPVGVAFDAGDNLYVLNRGGTSAFCTNGSVIEYDVYGFIVTTNASHLTNAAAIALDTAGNIYVTERTNLVLRITPTTNMIVATVTASNAMLQGIAALPSGFLAVCDSRRNGIYNIDPNTGIWTTNAGFNGAGDGTGPNNVGVPNSLAKFLNPYGVAAAGDGTLIVSDYGNDRVKVVTATGITTNLYGVSSNDWVSASPPFQYPGWVDGTVSVPDALAGVAGRCPAGVALSPDGATVYTTEDFYHLLRRTTGTGFATFIPAPGVPTGLTAVVATNGQGQIEVVLTWSPVATGNVTNYLVERADGRQASGGPYTTKGETSGTSFTDTSVSTGTTYYYVIQAANGGGLGPQSQQVSVTTPTPPPPPPTIGWFDYEWNGVFFGSVFHPITNGIYVTANDLMFALEFQNGNPTYYITGPTPLLTNPTNGIVTTVPFNPNQTSQTALTLNTFSNMTIAATTAAFFTNGSGGLTATYSAISSAEIIYQTATPVLLNATNAALFNVFDATTNVTYYYTTDGSDPLTNQIVAQSLVSTNLTMQFGLNISSNFIFSVRAFRAGYVPSPLVTNLFLAQNFVGNELSWGFASGYCSSTFVGSPGEWFYAPVTLTTLSPTALYGLVFDMTVTNLATAPAVTPGAYSFDSMLMQAITGTNGITEYVQIPPYMFLGEYTGTPPAGQVVNYNGTNFVDLETVNTALNELAVGWFEEFGKTNLFNTTKQSLVSASIAFIDLLPNAEHPTGTIVGGYAFQVPTNALPGAQYEIQLQRASGNNNGIGGENTAVLINTPTTGSLSNGPINGIKIVTVAQPKYLAGDIYPFQWFNAGNFGNGDLITYAANDIEETFIAAIYQVNQPPPNSDLFDAMDSAGGFGITNAGGYWVKSGTLTQAQLNLLFNVNNNTTINEMAFGDGNLDVCDVFTTFVRSQFPDLNWFQRFYTNDPVNGVFGRVAQAITVQTNVGNSVSSPSGIGSLKSADTAQGPVSITNTPTVHFAAGDYLASAGQTLSIPVTATVYGPAPLRMLMFNVNVTPLDGSPALTTPVTFSPNAPFNNSSIYNAGLETNTTVNYAEAFLPTTFPISESGDVSGSNVIGYLNITIPSSATSSSAYALSFAHASGSPNGLISFPKTTYTGLITLSSRTNSTYGDGIPDSWRLRYFGTIYNQLSVSNADADGTGMCNWQKYLAGLNPNDPASVLNEGTDQAMAQNPQDMVLYWPSVNNQTYIIKRSPTLFPAQWTAISTNIGDGTYMEVHDTSGGPNRYYEVTTP